MERRKTAKDELDRMIEEATVDCYSEDEAFMGIVCYLADRMSFPFNFILYSETEKRYTILRLIRGVSHDTVGKVAQDSILAPSSK